MRNLLLVIVTFTVLLHSSTLVFAEKKEKKPERPILGWSEKITLVPGELTLHARLDSSRASSTLHVSGIKRFVKGKQVYVKFAVKDRYGNQDNLERKVLRSSGILTVSGTKLSRYVVELGFCIGGEYFEDEIALSDKLNSNYDIRLGRQSLEGHFVIDPALSYTTKPDCKVDSKK